MESKVVGSVKGLKTSEMRERNHKASLVPCVAATYSLSIVDRETSSWHLDDHETALPLMRNAYLETARQSSAMLPSASVYPRRARSCSPYESQRSRVPVR